jgi:hypothetical protein
LRFDNVKPISQIRQERTTSEQERINLLADIQKLQNDRKTLMLAVTELYELLIQQQQSGGTS